MRHPETTSPMCHRVRDSSTGSSQQSRQLIGIESQRTRVSIRNSPSHIRRSLAHFNIVAKQHPNQRLQLSRTPTNLLGDSPRPRQSPRSLYEHLPNRRHAAKYKPHLASKKKPPESGGRSHIPNKIHYIPAATCERCFRATQGDVSPNTHSRTGPTSTCTNCDMG